MTGRFQKGNTYAKPTLREQKSWPMRHVSGSYPHPLKISSRSFFLLPPAFQSFQISSETFLEPLARRVKIRLALLRIALGDRWRSPTLKRGARGSCMSGISSETASKESKGSGTGASHWLTFQVMVGWKALVKEILAAYQEVWGFSRPH